MAMAVLLLLLHAAWPHNFFILFLLQSRKSVIHFVSVRVRLICPIGVSSDVSVACKSFGDIDYPSLLCLCLFILLVAKYFHSYRHNITPYSTQYQQQ